MLYRVVVQNYFAPATRIGFPCSATILSSRCAVRWNLLFPATPYWIRLSSASQVLVPPSRICQHILPTHIQKTVFHNNILHTLLWYQNTVDHTNTYIVCVVRRSLALLLYFCVIRCLIVCCYHNYIASN